MDDKDLSAASATLAAAILSTKQSQSTTYAARLYMDMLIALRQEYENRKAELPASR